MTRLVGQVACAVCGGLYIGCHLLDGPPVRMCMECGEDGAVPIGPQLPSGDVFPTLHAVATIQDLLTARTKHHVMQARES